MSITRRGAGNAARALVTAWLLSAPASVAVAWERQLTDDSVDELPIGPEPAAGVDAIWASCGDVPCLVTTTGGVVWTGGLELAGTTAGMQAGGGRLLGSFASGEPFLIAPPGVAYPLEVEWITWDVCPSELAEWRPPRPQDLFGGRSGGALLAGAFRNDSCPVAGPPGACATMQTMDLYLLRGDSLRRVTSDCAENLLGSAGAQAAVADGESVAWVGSRGAEYPYLCGVYVDETPIVERPSSEGCRDFDVADFRDGAVLMRYRDPGAGEDVWAISTGGSAPRALITVASGATPVLLHGAMVLVQDALGTRLIDAAGAEHLLATSAELAHRGALGSEPGGTFAYALNGPGAPELHLFDAGTDTIIPTPAGLVAIGPPVVSSGRIGYAATDGGGGRRIYLHAVGSTLEPISSSDWEAGDPFITAEGHLFWIGRSAFGGDTEIFSGGLGGGSSCLDECTSEGARRCSGTQVQTCGEFDADGCRDWSPPERCPAEGEVCGGGAGVCGPAMDGGGSDAGIDAGGHGAELPRPGDGGLRCAAARGPASTPWTHLALSLLAMTWVRLRGRSRASARG